ncbi:hypothetical protein D3C85_1501980 [compost metagenome]
MVQSVGLVAAALVVTQQWFECSVAANARIIRLTLWRGSLLPLGGAAAVIKLNADYLTHLDGCIGTAAPSSASKFARHESRLIARV